MCNDINSLKIVCRLRKSHLNTATAMMSGRNSLSCFSRQILSNKEKEIRAFDKLN
jgi:hypothetical protein